MPSGNFALGTLSGACLEKSVFEINVEDQTTPRMSILTPNSETVSELHAVLFE